MGGMGINFVTLYTKEIWQGKDYAVAHSYNNIWLVACWLDNNNY